MIVDGMLRVRNEQRWIERCLLSLRFCRRVVLFDDHSTDRTAEIARDVFPGLIYLRSPYPDDGQPDEVRDKNFLLRWVRGLAPTPHWIVAPDGDEELTATAQAVCAAPPPNSTVLELRIAYLWDREDQVRTDGVYGRFSTARAFMVAGQPTDIAYAGRGFGGGFHCGSYPKTGFRAVVHKSEARILHYGYVDAELRRRKLEFYRRHDPDNTAEDNYRHLTQGDEGGEPARARLRHAGPLRLERIERIAA